jgi:hypothetical protein
LPFPTFAIQQTVESLIKIIVNYFKIILSPLVCMDVKLGFLFKERMQINDVSEQGTEVNI